MFSHSLGQDQELDQRLELDTKIRRVEIHLNSLQDYYAVWAIGEDKKVPETVAELEALKQPYRDGGHHVVPDEGWVCVVDIDDSGPTVSLAWPRSRGENSDGSIVEGALQVPRRVKVNSVEEILD